MRKTALRELVGAILLTGAILAPVRAVHSQEDQLLAPYLYYHSGILDGFVIERADGTDSRILAQNVIPETHNEIYRPTWSPSGKWLAWRSADFGGPGPSRYSGWVISSDGSERLTMLDHSPEAVVNVSTMAWAPAADMLLVVETIADEMGDGALVRYLLIDAEAGAIRASHEFDVESFWNDDPVRFSWLPDGQGAALYKTAFGGDERWTLQVVELRVGGTTKTAAYSAWYGLSWFSDGRLAYISPDEQRLVIENLVDGSSQTFPLTGRPPAPGLPGHFDRLVWNHNYNVAMFYMLQEENYDLWLLDLTAQDHLLIKSDVRLFTVRSLQAGRLVDSRPGTWSPDGSRYVFLTTDGSHWLFELEGCRVTLLENLPEYETITWAENGRQLLLEADRGVYVYDLISQESTFIPQLINAEAYSGYREAMVYFPSPDGRFMGLTSYHTIVDLKHGSARSFSGHTAATYAPAYVSYDWHPAGLWVIAAGNVTFAGCCGPDAFTVLKSDPAGGDGRRELTVNWGDSTGWLPKRVIPYLAEGQPESVFQQPVLTHRFGDTVAGLAWNPTGDQLAVYTSSGEVSIEEFDYTAGGGVRTAAFQMRAYCSGSRSPCPMYWEDETIVVGNQAWNPGQQTYADANYDDRIECTPYDCIERLSDAVSPDGRWRARVRDGNTVEVVDTGSGDIVETFEMVVDMEWVDDRLVMIVEDKVIIFAADTLRSTLLESAMSKGYRDRFYTMSISPDGRLVAGASPYNEIHLWDIESGELVTVLNWYGMAIAFSPDGRWLAAGNSDLVTIWDVSEY